MKTKPIKKSERERKHREAYMTIYGKYYCPNCDEMYDNIPFPKYQPPQQPESKEIWNSLTEEEQMKAKNNEALESKEWEEYVKGCIDFKTIEDRDACLNWINLLLEEQRIAEREATIKKYKHLGYVDATPDGNYALRILQNARERCNEMWSDNTAGLEIKNPLLKELNKMQKQRAKELDKAIRVLSLIRENE